MPEKTCRHAFAYIMQQMAIKAVAVNDENNEGRCRGPGSHRRGLLLPQQQQWTAAENKQAAGRNTMCVCMSVCSDEVITAKDRQNKGPASETIGDQQRPSCIDPPHQGAGRKQTPNLSSTE